MKKILSIFVMITIAAGFNSCKKETIEDKLMHYFRLINAKKGLYAEDLKTGKVIQNNQTNEFHMGSIMRIPVLVALYYQASKGKANLYQKIPIGAGEFVYGTGIIQNFEDVKQLSLRELAKIMMYADDVTAMDAILKVLGIENIKKAFEEMKISGINITMDNNSIVKKVFELEGDQYKMLNSGMIRSEAYKKESAILAMDSARLVNIYSEINTASPSAIAMLLKKLLAKELMPENFTKEVLEILALGGTNNNLINYSLPVKTNIYGASSYSLSTMSNASIIMNEKTKMLFIILTNYNRDGKTISLRRLAYISRLAYMNAQPVVIE